MLVVSQDEAIFCSSKDPSLKELQEVAARMFAKSKTEAENTNAEVDSKKKQQNKDSSANLSPLARFLLSRFVMKIPCLYMINEYN